MAPAGLFCHVCRNPIGGDDFARGQAVTVLRRHYCLKCSNHVAGIGSERLYGAPAAGLAPWRRGRLLLGAVAVLAAAALALWMSRRG